jgi:predicted transcriptional regulator
MPVQARRSTLGDRPISELALTGKELQLENTVGDARVLLARRSVKAVPVLSGETYVGAVDADSLGDAPDEAPVGPLVRDLVPMAWGGTRAAEALDVLDRVGGTRLVVLDEEHGTYVGVVCLRRDRKSLCVDETTVIGGAAEGTA